MADDPFEFERATIRIGDGPEIPVPNWPAGMTASQRVRAILDHYGFAPRTEPVEITYMSDAPRVPNLIVGGDLHAEWSMPMSNEDIDAAIQAANDMIERRVIDGETVEAERKEIEG